MLLKNAMIYTMEDEIIDKGYINIQNGIITDIGKNTNAKGIDLSGKCVTPGFIDCHTHLGVFGSGLGFEAEDANEDTDPLTPHLRTIDGINPMDLYFEDAKKSGVTSVVTGVGSANPIGGDLVAVKTYGRRIDDMLIRKVGIKFAFGENPKSVYSDKSQTPVTRMATAALIREQLYKAKEYMNKDEKDFDIKCESLIPLLKGEIAMHAHAHRADDIFTAIRIAKEFNLDLKLVHCTEGHLIADELKTENSQVICGPLISDRGKPELTNFKRSMVVELNKKGIITAIATDHPETPITYLQLTAQIAVKEGMDKLEALKCVTIYPAKIAGIDDKVGSIKIGKDADLIVHSGDPMSFDSKIEKVITKNDCME